MKWINKQLSRLTHAEGYRAIAFGGLVGLITGFSVSAFQGIALDICVLISFISVLPGAVVMTALFVLLSNDSSQQST